MGEHSHLSMDFDKVSIVFLFLFIPSVYLLLPAVRQAKGGHKTLKHSFHVFIPNFEPQFGS
jgi:hypothetical protein